MSSNFNSCWTLDKKLCFVCENEYKYFLNKQNVVGIAFGCKIVNGFYTSEKCITVFVREKKPCFNLLSDEIIPKFYKGFKTDVKQCSIPVFKELRTRIRPAVNGYSIGSAISQDYGTSACLVADEYIYILSNNHVFALNNTAPIKSSIVQPAVYDGGRMEKDVIGHLNKFIPIQFIEGSSQPPNFVDCALCKPISSSFVSPNIAYVGVPKGTAKGKVGDNVKKIGRTTEMTIGKITYLSGTFIVECEYVNKHGLFKEQILTNSMGSPGDSGSLLLNEDNYALGLYMAGVDDINLFNPIEKVLSSLNVKLVTG